MTHYGTLLSVVIFWIFMPLFLMVMNVSGFSQFNTDLYEDVTSEDFSFFTVDGFGTGLRFIVELSKYSITGLPVFMTAILIVMAAASILAGLYFIRGI